jgi:hypothetical protein
VIRSFKAEETERLFSGWPTRRLQGVADLEVATRISVDRIVRDVHPREAA